MSQRALFILLCMPAHFCLMDLLCFSLLSGFDSAISKTFQWRHPVEDDTVREEHSADMLLFHLALFIHRSPLSTVELEAVSPELSSPPRKT